MPRKTTEYWDRPENRDLRDTYVANHDHARKVEKFGSIIEDRNEPTDWGGRICIAIGILFISYLIARTVATFVWGV